jgi:hypothetical protein
MGTQRNPAELHILLPFPGNTAYSGSKELAEGRKAIGS